MSSSPDKRFQHPVYTCEGKWFSLLHRDFYFRDPQGAVLLFARMKAFHLKEDIRVYAGPDMAEELLTIKARKIIDFSSAYDVVDTKSATKVGMLKRAGLHSLVKDKWMICGAADEPIGQIDEDDTLLALLRRYLMNLIPQNFTVSAGGAAVAEFRQNFNPFHLKLALDFSKDASGRLDRRLGIAAALLLCAIEGRQD